jgi:CRP-like cAMP-binding protein
MNIAAGKILCMQGDNPHSFYIVKKGTLVATFKNEQNDVQIKNLGPGSTFGELSLVEGEPLEYTIRAEDDSEIEVIPQSLFQETIAEQPIWMKSIISFLTQRNHIAKENKRKKEFITTFPSLLFILAKSEDKLISLKTINNELKNFSNLSSLETYKLLLILQDFKLIRLQAETLTIENEKLLEMLYDMLRLRAIYKNTSHYILSLTEQAVLSAFVKTASEKGEHQSNGIVAVKTTDLAAQTKHSMHGMTLTLRSLETLLQKRLLQASTQSSTKVNDLPGLEYIEMFSADFERLLNLLELNRIYPQLDKKLVVV